MIKTNCLDDKIPKESMHYTCIASVTIESVNYSQVYLEECKYKSKKI